VRKQTFHFGGAFEHLPYSDVVRAGDLLFVSGVVAWDAATDAPVAGGIEAQTAAVMEKIKRILESVESSLDHVVKMTVYLTDRKDFPGMNNVYRTYFPGQPPARATIGATLMEPDLLVEIETVALAGGTVPPETKQHEDEE